MKLFKSQSAFTLIELLVVITIIALLAGVSIPVLGNVKMKAAQTKALSNAKQVAMACRIYSSDNNGRFPGLVTDDEGEVGTANVSSSNEAFRQLLPDYLPDEKMFYVPNSGFTRNPPDDVVDGVSGLKRGENHWAYVLNLSDTSNSAFPLIADGFANSQSHNYVTDETLPGGVWKGKSAIVVRVDASANIEKVDKNSMTVMRNTPSGKVDMFRPDPNNNWMGAANTTVNPLAN